MRQLKVQVAKNYHVFPWTQHKIMLVNDRLTIALMRNRYYPKVAMMIEEHANQQHYLPVAQMMPITKMLH